jgi:hypothetical protein
LVSQHVPQLLRYGVAIMRERGNTWSCVGSVSVLLPGALVRLDLPLSRRGWLNQQRTRFYGQGILLLGFLNDNYPYCHN